MNFPTVKFITCFCAFWDYLINFLFWEKGGRREHLPGFSNPPSPLPFLPPGSINYNGVFCEVLLPG